MSLIDAAGWDNLCPDEENKTKHPKKKRKDVCMRCEHGKGYFVGESIIFIEKDGSVSIDADGEIIDFPAKTIKFCPWCGMKLSQ